MTEQSAASAAGTPGPAPGQVKKAEHDPFTAIFLVKRKDGMSFEAFTSYQIETHVPLALRLPGLQDYRIRFFPPDNGDGQAIDALVEVRFSSAADYEAAMSSAEGARALADLPNMLDTDAMTLLIAGDRYDGGPASR